MLFVFVTCQHPFEGEATGSEDAKYRYIMKKKYDKFWKHHEKKNPDNAALKSL